MNLMMTIQLGDVFKIETDDDVIYGKVQSLVGSSNDAFHISLQATDRDGKVHIIDLCKIKNLPNGWAGSTWSRLKCNTL